MMFPPPAASPGLPPFRPATPVVIGLVGGIASGKSTVAGMFAARGLRHVDADGLARQVAAEPAVREQVATRFGPGFVTEHGLDRPALAARVFADAEARRALEAILHPRIRAAILAELDAARAAGQSVLLDVPLLFETGLVEQCDRVVFVAADEAVRRVRAHSRGWADDELARREHNQLPVAEKQRRADHVVDNGGELAATAAAVDALLGRLAEELADNRP